MIGIYRIVSPVGKIYIGQSINIENRKKTYKYSNSYTNSIGPKIYNSINKHGWNKHQHEIIEECSLEQLNERETYWKQYYIDLYGWNNMLFCELYDTGGGSKSEETKANISKGKLGTKGYPKGIKRPKEFGESIKSSDRNRKIGESHKGKLKPGSGNNKPLSNDHKNNISTSSKGISRNKKQINQYDLDGNYIKTWDSRTEAKKWLGKGDIAGCLSEKQSQAGGYIWKYI
jgi:group I intron endonuclease